MPGSFYWAHLRLVGNSIRDFAYFDFTNKLVSRIINDAYRIFVHIRNIDKLVVIAGHNAMSTFAGIDSHHDFLGCQIHFRNGVGRTLLGPLVSDKGVLVVVLDEYLRRPFTHGDLIYFTASQVHNR